MINEARIKDRIFIVPLISRSLFVVGHSHNAVGAVRAVGAVIYRFSRMSRMRRKCFHSILLDLIAKLAESK
jgi:hypothetical protein